MGVPVWALVALVVVPVAVVTWSGRPSLFPAERRREVLPAHYASLVTRDPANVPGHCTACGTTNEPGYTFCESCGAEVPTTDGPARDVDLDAIFDA